MAASNNKTTENESSVARFLDAVEKEIRRKDAFELLKIFEPVTNEQPKMWEVVLLAMENTITNTRVEEKVIL